MIIIAPTNYDVLKMIAWGLANVQVMIYDLCMERNLAKLDSLIVKQAIRDVASKVYTRDIFNSD